MKSCTCIKNAVATSSSTAAKSTSEVNGDSSDGYIQLLNMVVEDKRTRNVFLKSSALGGAIFFLLQILMINFRMAS